MAHLEGYVSHIRFHNEENGYTVMEIETTHGDEVLVGNFHYINEGEYICAEGEYVDHPAHGPQYRMTSYTVKEPEDKAAMERYLASGAIKGMGDPFFCKYICPQGVLEGAIPLSLGNTAIRSALGKLFSFKLIILIMVILLSILFYRPFCKWICPLGAIYSLFNKISFLSIKVEDDKCVGCHQCTKVCKMDVDVIKSPNHPECIRCGACMKACPKDAIHYQFIKFNDK